MELQENKSLKQYNTFGIDCKARLFVTVNTINELQEVLKENPNENKFFLGGGSNILLLQYVDALVIHLNLKGISITEETDDFVIIEAMAGENWHDFVLHCINHNYGGIENLSLIPGNIGTAPIQNIGAYGVELKDTFVNCKALHIESKEIKTFALEDCKFGYRDSIFKQDAKGKYVITSVQLKLTKKEHQIHTSYGVIQNVLEEKGIKNPTIKDISNAVIEIRQSKLPDPSKIGNSGSFFKNPVISCEAFKLFQKNHPEAPYYKVSDNKIKVPAGWLIEKTGLKGYRNGDAGVHIKQALVLVNYGNASGEEILEVAKKVQKTVLDQFQIKIEPEVNII